MGAAVGQVDLASGPREQRLHISGEIHVVINTTQGAAEIKDSFSVRRTALMRGLPYYTTMSGARAAVGAIAKLQAGSMTVCSLQEFQNAR